MNIDAAAAELFILNKSEHFLLKKYRSLDNFDQIMKTRLLDMSKSCQPGRQKFNKN